MTDKLLVITHCGSRREAETIARALLRRRWIACANLGGRVASCYRWRGRLERALEYPLWLKTTRSKYAQVEREIQRLHSYQVPEIIALEIARGSAAYLNWIAEVTMAASKSPRRKPQNRPKPVAD